MVFATLLLNARESPYLLVPWCESNRVTSPANAAEARGARHRAGAEGRGRAARAPHTHSIADGTALRCGRGGSRHFRRHRGFIPRGLFVYVATRHRRSVLPLSEGAASAEDGNSPPSTLPAFYLSVKKKKILRSKDTDVRFTELLIGGGERKKYRYRP